MSKIISYSLEEILKYKNVNINILTEELSNSFDNINNSFLQSTQYLENRKKINYNQINSSKWKKINSNINTKLLSLLNKITDETFSNVLEKILNSDITNHKQLDKLSNDIYSKILNDLNNNKLYCLIIKQIIDAGIWYYKDIENSTSYLNFRIYFINKINQEFEECLEMIDLIKDKYDNDENGYFSIKNKCNVVINTIINLHLSNILSNDVINYVIDSLIAKFSDTNQDVIEYLCKINEIHNYEDVEVFLKNLLKNNKLQSRYKFMIEDMNRKPNVKEVKVKVNVTDEYKKFLTDANLDALKKHIGENINYLELLAYVFDKLLSVNLNEIEKYLNLIKKIKERMNKDEYNEYISENLSEFISELPILSKYKERIV